MKHQFKFEGKDRMIFRRGGRWYLRLFTDGKDRWFSLKTSAQGSAVELAKSLIKARAQKTTADLNTALGHRPAGEPRLADIVSAFKGSPSQLFPNTRNGYLWGLRSMIQSVHGTDPDWTTHPLRILTADLVSNYRTAILRKAKEARASGADIERAKRSANSCLRQARAVFSEHLLEYYRLSCNLELPDLHPFRTAIGFKGAAKNDYHAPDDDLIRHTLDQLEATRETHPARYLACWLSLGFGLRKSEVSAARGNWFKLIQGRPHIEIRAVSALGGECDVTKNGAQAPRVPVANGAWPRLEPLITPVAPDDYLIGGTMTYRTETIFREINAWFRGLGWNTQKGFHELRAYAGCQVALKAGLYSASQWLRHESVTTTQKFYGRYLKIQVPDAPLDLAPVLEPEGLTEDWRRLGAAVAERFAL